MLYGVAILTGMGMTTNARALDRLKMAGITVRDAQRGEMKHGIKSEPSKSDWQQIVILPPNTPLKEQAMQRRIKRAKPCPFCGSREIFYTEGEGWFIYCRECNGQIGDERSKAKLLERWNRRADSLELNPEGTAFGVKIGKLRKPV